MFRGVYMAASGMIAAERRQHQLSNNLANAQTPGYKQAETVMRSFPEMLIQRLEGRSPASPGQPMTTSTPIGRLHTGVYAQENIPLFTQGSLQHTGRALDLAIIDQWLPINPETNERGQLFFAVRVGEDDIRYTRNGQLALDPEGYLVTANGQYVLSYTSEVGPDGEPIIEESPIFVGNEDFTVTESGLVIVQPGTEEEEVYNLYLAYTEQPQHLVQEGTGLWRWEGEQEGIVPIGQAEFLNDEEFGANGVQPYTIRQGFIEQSNVDITRTMTEMLSMYRLYEANQRVLQAYDRSMERAANEIGRLY